MQDSGCTAGQAQAAELGGASVFKYLTSSTLDPPPKRLDGGRARQAQLQLHESCELCSRGDLRSSLLMGKPQPDAPLAGT